MLEFLLDKTPIDFTPPISTTQLYLSSNYTAIGAPYETFTSSGQVDRSGLGGQFSASKGNFDGEPFFYIRHEPSS